MLKQKNRRIIIIIIVIIIIAIMYLWEKCLKISCDFECKRLRPFGFSL
jgi:accessory gene regulator protein AgrB